MRFPTSPVRIGSIGAVRSNAWIRLFSSTHKTIACSGGAQYSPTTSVTLPMSSGSVENVNVSLRQGCTPYLRHALATVAFPIFNWSASNLDDQCVTPSFVGGAVNVAVMIRSSSTTFSRPDLAASSKPASPAVAYRFRHFHTEVVVVPTSTAIRAFATPSAANSTMRARCTSPARIDVDRVHAANSSPWLSGCSETPRTRGLRQETAR